VIIGTVNASREAIVRFRVQGPGGLAEEIAAIVDTGFNGRPHEDGPEAWGWAAAIPVLSGGTGRGKEGCHKAGYPSKVLPIRTVDRAFQSIGKQKAHSPIYR
jgi:hypothetical protein